MEQKYREEIGKHGVSMYFYFFAIFQLPPYIPTYTRYSWLVHIILLLTGISAYSIYSYFFPVFLLPPCIPTSSRYICSLYREKVGIPGRSRSRNTWNNMNSGKK
jgi:hypothetical protein